MPDEGEKVYNVFIICDAGAVADLFFKEMGAKGSKFDHALVAVCGVSVVVLWIKKVSAIERFHDSGCKAVW